METNARYTLVGASLLLFLILFILFVVWFSHSGLTRQTTPYDIYFTNAVNGLQEGSVVRYRGIPAGNVHRIRLDPNNIEHIIVTVDIRKDIPIKKDAYAALELQGITGNTFIQIHGGTQDSPLLPRPSKGNPVIPAHSSRFERFINFAPEMMEEVKNLLADARQFFSPDNKEALTQILQSLSQTLQEFVGKEGKKGAPHHLQKGLQELTQTLQEVRKTLKESSSPALNSLASFLEQAKRTLAALERIGDSLERSPRRFLLQKPDEGVPLS